MTTAAHPVYARGYEYSEYNIDGLPAQMQSINGTLPNLFAFDRVEVMRWPSGLFDSSGEMGGIVNLVRKRRQRVPRPCGSRVRYAQTI